jgi:hypothetical protein
MATWREFAGGGGARPGRADVLRVQAAGKPGRWEPLEGGSGLLAAAGERLLSAPPGIALLATVSGSGVPRVHPFMPRVVEGELVAFVIARSPKLRDLLEGRPCVIHSALADEDEEFWVQARATEVTEPALEAAALEAMTWAKQDLETLVRFDLELAGWTRWLDFGTAGHRPLHHRWIAP